MQNRTAVEGLESRFVMAAPVIGVGPNNVYLNAVQGHSATYVVRVTNTGNKQLILGAGTLRIKGDDPSAFKVLDFPSAGLRVNPGARRYLTVRFTAPSGTTAVQNATLRLTSNDPHHPVTSTPLYGLPTKGEGGNLEPSLQAIFNLYHVPIDSGETDASNYLYPSTPSSTSDEIDAQTFVKAGAGKVTIAPIAQFTNDATPNVRVGTYTPGVLDSEKYLYAVDGSNGQTVNPEVYGTTSFDPGSTEFGLVSQYPHFVNADGSVRDVYSEQVLNQTWDTNTSTHHFRVYPFIDQAGKTVANSYVVAEEEYTTAYDNQDLVFVVTNVKPVTGSPTLSYENLTGYPANDILSFNKVQTPDVNVANITRLTNTLRVRNSGSTALTLSTAVSGDGFSISSGGGTNVTLAPGERRDIQVKFDATSGASVHKGVLTLTSNDPDQKTVPITLLGNWQEYSEQSPSTPHIPNEPPAQTIVQKLLGYTSSIPLSSSHQGSGLNNGGHITKSSADEVLAQYFTAADTNAAVRVTELATFHSQTYTASDGTEKPTNSHFGWFVKGSPDASYKTILTDKVAEGQMVLPVASSGSAVANGSFDAKGQTFGFVTDRPSGGLNTTTSNHGEYSDYSLNLNPNNESNFGQFLRFFVARDGNGVVIPNTYIVLHDYNTSAVNYDFNDNVYLISNIIPTGEVKTPIIASAVHGSAGVTINFAGPVDGDVKVTGFDVLRSDTATGTYALLTDTPLARAGTNIFTDTTAADGKSYYYEIITLGSGGKQSDPVTVTA